MCSMYILYAAFIYYIYVEHTRRRYPPLIFTHQTILFIDHNTNKIDFNLLYNASIKL